MGNEPLVIITNLDGTPRRKWRATETVDVDGTPVVRPHVGAGQESDHIQVRFWNNKKTKEVVDLVLAMDNGSPNFEPVDLASPGDVTIQLDDNDYVVNVSEAGMNEVATEIANNFNATHDSSGWVAAALPGEVFKGKVIRRAIVEFTNSTYGPTGEVNYNKQTSDLNATINKVIIGNDALEPKSNITDVELYVKDTTGGHNSRIVTDRWIWARKNDEASFTNLGVTVDPISGEVTSETKLDLKAKNASVPAGEIEGGINDGLETDDKNYCEIELYAEPPQVVVSGLSPFVIIGYYNFV